MYMYISRCIPLIIETLLTSINVQFLYELSIELFMYFAVLVWPFVHVGLQIVCTHTIRDEEGALYVCVNNFSTRNTSLISLRVYMYTCVYLRSLVKAHVHILVTVVPILYTSVQRQLLSLFYYGIGFVKN